MKNILWFICLAIISLGSAAYAIYMNRHKYKISTFVVFYLFAASVAWIGEFIVLGVFNAYAYKTGVFDNPWAQNLLGHLILNTSIYPASVIVMVAYSFGYGWISFAAALLSMSEYFFVKQGLYEQHWWRYYMTIIAVVVILAFNNKWFSKIKKGCAGLTRSITFYFVAMIIIHIPAPILLLLRKQYYQLDMINNMFVDLYLSSIIIIFSYHLIESFLLVVITCVLKKWYWKVAPFVFSIAAQSLFVKTGILIIENGWSLVHTLFLYEIFITIFILVEKYTLKQDSN